VAPLAYLSEGDFLGRIPFLDTGQEPDGASVLGSGDLKVRSISLRGLREEHDRLSATFRNLIEHVAQAVSVTSRVASGFLKEAKNTPKGRLPGR
jgi:hypothetical protein